VARVITPRRARESRLKEITIAEIMRVVTARRSTWASAGTARAWAATLRKLRAIARAPVWATLKTAKTPTDEGGMKKK
jgi:hypothetical protein